MELEGHVLVSPTAEVPVIEGDVVTAIRTLAERGVGKKSIAREVDVAMNTVRRYLRQSIAAGVPTRPARRLLRRASPVRRMSSMRARPRATRWWCSGCWRRVTSRALPSVKVAVFGEGPTHSPTCQTLRCRPGSPSTAHRTAPSEGLARP